MNRQIIAAALPLALVLTAACKSTSAPTDTKAVAQAEQDTRELVNQTEAAAKASVAKAVPPSYVTYEVDGRLWVFEDGSEDLAAFKSVGEPAKSVTLVGMGPGGKTLRGGSKEVLLGFVYQKPGFHVVARDERLWVFEEGSEHYVDFLTKGEPAKSVTLLGIGPDGRTMRGAEREVVLRYCNSKPGFFIDYADDRLWVFHEGSDAHAEYLASGEPAKSITMIGAGPGGCTIRSDEKEVILEYLATKPGFHVAVRPLGDGHVVWVLAEGSEALAEFERSGEPAKNVSRIGAGPLGVTVRSDSGETIDAWAAR